MLYIKTNLILILILALVIFSLSFNQYSTISIKDSAANDTILQSMLNEMTLREKIAQMIISSSLGENYDDDSKELLKMRRLCEELKIGGFIFLKGNAIGYTKLSNKLQSYSKTPLLISADFERGTKMRLSDGSLFPNNMALGATDNPLLAYEMAEIIAGESRSLGVQQNYGPVCDVNNNPDNPIINVRSYGEDPQLVSRMSEMFIKGLQDNKVIATAKHFPGHGDTDIDSHSDLPVLNFDMDRLNKIELVPFKNAVNKDVMSVMIAHLSFPVLEPDAQLASSLSSNIVDNLLISQLGFKGLIVTDALNMKGITKYYSTEDVAVLCVKAGIDLILMPLDEEKSINAIENAIHNNEISEERIDHSVEKILKAKKWAGLFENKFVSEADVYKLINTDAAQKVAQKIADESITLVKEDKKILPVKLAGQNIILFNIGDVKDNSSAEYLSSSLNSTNTSVNVFNINDEITDNDIQNYINYAANSDVILYAIFAKVKFGTGKISILPSHVKLLEKLHNLNTKLLTVSFGNPYLLKNFDFVDSYICTYSDSEVSINALINAIKGDIKFRGKLPVSLTDVYRFGTGISN